MAMTIRVDIVSAEESLFSGSATMVFASAQMGEVGIAPRHTAFISQLKPGDVRIQDEHGNQQTFYVSGGIIEVQPNVVTILADTAIRAKDIDEAAALEAKRRAEEALSGSASKLEHISAQAHLAEALAQLRTLDKIRRKQS